MAVCQLYESKCQWLQIHRSSLIKSSYRLVAVVTDGASVMRGWKTGFVARLRKALNKEHLISHHCLAHVTDLILSNSIKDGTNKRTGEAFPFACHQNCKNVQKGINLISKFFRKSHKNTIFMKNFVSRKNKGK